MANRLYLPREQVFSDTGTVLAGAKLEAYEAGTSTPKDTYSDAGLTTANTNPVVADSAGRFGDIFLATTGDYKFILKNSAGTVIWTADNYAAFAGATAATQSQVDARTATNVFVTPASIADGVGLQGASIASASSLDIPAVGDYFAVTGTTTITALETRTAGREITLKFDGALQITHNATSLILPGAASITTAAGDVAIFRSEGSGNWRCVAYLRAAAPASGLGSVAQMVNTQTGAVATGTTNIPNDDTIPQNTEGVEYMTLAITPKKSTSTLFIETVWVGTVANSGEVLTAALFQDSTADALAAVSHTVSSSGLTVTIVLRHKMTSGTTSSTTFKLRVGGTSGNTVTFNGTGGARRMGGVMASSITITEYV